MDLIAKLQIKPGQTIAAVGMPDGVTSLAGGVNPAAEPGTADVVVAGDASVDMPAAVTALAHRGHRRILAEGGPVLLGQLIATGQLDELCLTVSPLLAGPGAGRIVQGAPLPDGTPAPALTLAHVLTGEGYLFCRYLC